MRKKQPPTKGAKGDVKRGVDTSMIVRTKDFDKPVVQLKKGGYKMKPGLVYLGFSTDFLCSFCLANCNNKLDTPW